MNTEYDLAVIGGGSAGLTAAGIAASVGVKTVLIEQDRLGGDCTWTGCVPSKTLLAQAHQIHTASKVTGQDSKQLTDFPQIAEKISSVQESIYEEADSPKALEKFGVYVLPGRAKFVDNQTLKVDTESNTERLRAVNTFVASGASPIVPPIDGLDDIEYLTSDNLFQLETQPHQLVIVGGGPIGVEMAQAFNRLGTTVELIESQDSLLPSDTELSRKLQTILSKEGVNIHTGAPVQTVADTDQGVKATTGSGKNVAGDALLLAVGRSANTEGLNLPAVGVEVDEHENIKTGAYGQTSRSNIYAIGDVTAGPRFTHQSEYEAKRAVFKSLFSIPLPKDTLTPRVTYTDPELAAVGKSRRELEVADKDYDVYRFPYEKLDRANTDGKTNGGIMVYTKQGGSSILGAQLLGPRAGELISELGLAMQNNLSLRDIAQTVHPYPSYGLGVRRAADQYISQNQPTWLLRMAKYLFGYRGEIYRPDEDEVI